jgi:hypothetical protein
LGSVEASKEPLRGAEARVFFSVTKAGELSNGVEATDAGSGDTKSVASGKFAAVDEIWGGGNLPGSEMVEGVPHASSDDVGALRSSSVAGAFFSSQYLGETLWNEGGAAVGPGNRGGGAVSGLTSPEPSTSLSAASNGGGEAVDRLNVEAKTLEIPPHLDPFAPPFEPGGTFSTATPSEAEKDSV